MRRVISRRTFLGTIPLAVAASSLVSDAKAEASAETETITYGDLKAVFRDNRDSPKILISN